MKLFALTLGLLSICAPALAADPPKEVPVNTSAPLVIDEGLFVPINGVEQWITIRGTDLKNPVLLILHGGPGFPSSGGALSYAEWEKHFTIVQWDQPGGGATYAKNIGKDIGPLTLDRYRKDGIAVAEYAAERLNAKKIVLLGTSWGALLGLELAHARPKLFSAVIGAAQPVGAKGQLLGYQLALKEARERGDTTAVAALEKAGPPPYKTFEDFLVRAQYVSPPGLPVKPGEQAAYDELVKALTTPPDPNANYIPKGLPPYNFFEVFLATIKEMYKTQEKWDAWKLGLNYKMPVFIFNGEYDINTPTELAMQLCNDIKAPAKACEVVPGAGHSTLNARLLFPYVKQHVLPVLSSKQN